MKHQRAVVESPDTLVSMKQFLPEGCHFNVTAAGVAQPFTTMGMVMGGAVRVGLEENVYYRKGEPAGGNAQLVGTHRPGAQIEPATPNEARAILGVVKKS